MFVLKEFDKISQLLSHLRKSETILSQSIDDWTVKFTKYSGKTLNNLSALVNNKSDHFIHIVLHKI